MGTTGRTALSDPRTSPSAIAMGEHIGSRPIRSDDDQEEIEIIYRIEGEPTRVTELGLTIGEYQVRRLPNKTGLDQWLNHVLFDVNVAPYVPAPSINPQSLVFMRFTNRPIIQKNQLSRELAGTTQSIEVYLDKQGNVIPGGPVPKTEQLAQVIYRWDEIKIVETEQKKLGDLEIAMLNHRNSRRFLRKKDKEKWLCTDFMAAEVRRTTDLNEYFLWSVQIVFTYDEHKHNTFTHPIDEETGLPDLDSELTIESEHYDLADFVGLMQLYGLIISR